MSIGEVACYAGVPASTLRYWESIGLLEAPERIGGKRRYRPEVLRRIALIVLIKRTGFTLAETRIILSGVSEETPPSEIWRELAERKLPEIKQTLAEATAMEKILEEGLRCNCLTLDDCLRQGDPDRTSIEAIRSVASKPDPRETEPSSEPRPAQDTENRPSRQGF